MNSRSVGRDVADHPAEPELDRRRAVVVGPGEPARVEVDVEEHETGLDPSHVQRGHPDRDHALAAGCPPTTASQTVSASAAGIHSSKPRSPVNPVRETWTGTLAMVVEATPK